MKQTIYQVDSFTKKAFKGNPAGVMIAKEDIEDALMQNIAMEMNLSETAFVNISEVPFSIRFFTPTSEIELCGHATLATAHLLYENKIIAKNEHIELESKVGLLKISKEANGIKMIFPVYKIEKTETPKNFKELIGFTPLEVYKCSSNWTIAIANNEKEIKDAKPAFNKMIENGLGHLMISALSERDSIDFVVRCFVTIYGIDEDPVTGSAQCGLVPVWNLRTGKSEFIAEQISERTGRLHVRLVDDTVEIIGNAVTIFEAQINL